MNARGVVYFQSAMLSALLDIFICWFTLPADLKIGICQKKGSVTNWREMSIQGTLMNHRKNFTLLICPILYKYNYKVVNSNNCTLSKIVLCKCYLTLEIYGA